MSNIIMLSTARFGNTYSSTAVSLAKEFSKKNRVFFIENPHTIKDVLFSSKKLTANRSITQMSTNLWRVQSGIVLSINWLPVGRLHKLFLKLNERLYSIILKRLIIQYDLNDFILINVFNPFYLNDFPFWLKPNRKVYYSVDSMESANYFSKHGVHLENKVLKNYEVVLTTSKALFEQAKKVNDKTYYLPNGANFRLFNEGVTAETLMPNDLMEISEPRVIYVGNIDFRIDIELMKRALQFNSAINYVFIGPVDNVSFSELENFDNFYLLGSRNLEKIPSYLKYAQCAIIPFVKNGFTKSIYPLKINEYLACGLPTVVTDFSESMKEFESIVSLCHTKEQFIESVSKNIGNNTTLLVQKRVEYASKNSWESRVEKFWKIINTI